MDKPLKNRNNKKLTYKGIDNPQSSMFIKEIKFIVKYLSSEKTPSPNDFTNDFKKKLSLLE